MLIKLMRPLNVILGAFSVLIIHSFLLFRPNTVFTILVVTCFIALSNIINDIFDQESDKKNHRQKIKKDQLIYIYIFLVIIMIIGIISTLQLNYYSQLVAFIILPFIVFYTPIFKGIPLIGNILVSILVGAVFIFSEISIKNSIHFSILPFIFSFWLSLIREIIKDLEDIKGDKESNIMTLPVCYGENITIKLSLCLMMSLNIIVLIPYLFNFYNLNYLLAVLIGIILPNSYCIVYLKKKRFYYHYKKIQSIQKMITIFGLFIVYFMQNNF